MKKMFLLKWAAVGIFLIITAAVFRLLNTYTHTDREQLFLTPPLNGTNGWEIYSVEDGIFTPRTIEEIRQMEPGKTIYFSRTLTRELEEGGYTLLRLSSTLPCAVFIDDRLLYTTCPGSAPAIGQVSFPEDYEGLSGRDEAVRCTLPEQLAGRDLTIASTTEYSEYGPIMPYFILSSEEIESEIAMVTVSHEIIPAAGFAAMALLLMLAWLFSFWQGVHHYQVLLPIAAALLQALSHLRELEFRSASFTALANPLTQFIPALSLLLPLVYLLLQIEEKRNRLLFGCILAISFLLAFIPPVAGLFGGLPFYSAFLAENVILYCPMTALLIFSFWEAKHGNTALRLFLSGLGIILSGIAILYIGSLLGEGYYADQISFVFKLIPGYNSTAFWGWCSIVLFLLSALISLHKIIRRMVQVHTDLALQSERLIQLDRQLLVQKDYYDARLSHEREIRSLRHDMNGHLNTLAMLLRDGQLAEAKKYLDGITEYHNGQTSKIFCGNPYINAVLQNYDAKCLEHHVALTCNIGIGDLELPATELCLILNNALENALDASLALPETERKIKVQAAVRQNLFLLRISNPFHGEVKTEKGLPVTTKQGKEHGYGLSNIRQAAERRDGSMEYRIEDGYFVLDVKFPID